MFIPKIKYIQDNNQIIRDKIVLDLACHDGESTAIIIANAARHVYAVDIRSHLIDHARKTIKGPVDFFVGDITDKTLIAPLVEKCQAVTFFGGLYHLFDHFRFFSMILQSNIEYCLIETLFGPESMNPEMTWGFEDTKNDLNGWCAGCDLIPNGTPNLSWILESARIFNFQCDWIQCHGQPQSKSIYNITLEEYQSVAGSDWPDYQDFIKIEYKSKIPKFVLDEISEMLLDFTTDHRRLILRLYNRSRIKSTPIDIKQHYIWPY